jgi:RND family efflux transporter MFP subunit
MNPAACLSFIFGVVRRLSLCLLSLATLVGCQRDNSAGAAKSQPPAKVAHPVDEQTLNTLTLSEKAIQRLGIRTAEVEQKEVQRRRTLGGEVVVPPGQTIVVSAPFAGVLSAPEGENVPAPGTKLSAGQAVFRFLPLLTPERDVLTPADRVRVAQTKADVATVQIEAERQVESAKVQVKAAEIAYQRAVQLLETKAGSQRSADEAQAQLDLAKEALKTAETRHKFLIGIVLDEEEGKVVPRTIAAPVTGILQSIDVAPGETVSMGEPLLTVVQLERLWIRVPVYAGERRSVQIPAPASVSEYGQPASAAPRIARYVAAPPTANPQAATVDLYYELDNADGSAYPGQRLSVTIVEKGTSPALTVPWAAVLYDVHGGAWVYEQTAPQVFVRRRVAVHYVDQGRAIVAHGPPAGTKVVTDGAAELFGTEFGIGK